VSSYTTARDTIDESRRKDRIMAKLTLEVDAMKELVEKNGWGSRNGKPR